MTAKNEVSSLNSGGPRFLLRAACAFVLAFLTLLLFEDGFNPVYLIALGALLTYLYGRLQGLRQKTRLTAVSGVFSLLLGFALYFGTKLDTVTGNVKNFIKLDLLSLPALFLTIFPCAFLLLEYLAKPPRLPSFPVDLSDSKRQRRFALGAAGLILLCYLFTWLTYFPAISTYDSWVVAAQSAGITPLNDWHPFLYTLLMRVFTGHSLWSLQTGVALFSLFQMLFMALSAGYTVFWLLKKGASPIFTALAALYYALPPVFAAFSMSLWKDVPFAAAVLLYSLCLYDLMESKGKLLRTVRGCLRYAALVFLTGMLRHNGFYVVLVITVILLLYFLFKQKKESLRLLPVLLVAAALVPVTNQVAYALGVEQGPSSEAMSIPAQQIARTYAKHGDITPEQLEELALYFDLGMLREYDPFLADPAKNSMDKEYYDAHKGGFLRLWLSLMGNNLEIYVQAYLLQTHGYWHPGDKPEAILSPTANELREMGVQKYDLLGRGAVVQIWENMTQPYDFISIGTLVWVMLFCAALLLIRKRPGHLIALLPVLGVWGTTMIAAPLSNSYRYMYALLLTIPLVLFLIFDTGKSGTQDSPEKRNTKSKPM